MVCGFCDLSIVIDNIRRPLFLVLFVVLCGVWSYFFYFIRRYMFFGVGLSTIPSIWVCFHKNICSWHPKKPPKISIKLGKVMKYSQRSELIVNPKLSNKPLIRKLVTKFFLLAAGLICTAFITYAHFWKTLAHSISRQIPAAKSVMKTADGKHRCTVSSLYVERLILARVFVWVNVACLMSPFVSGCDWASIGFLSCCMTLSLSSSLEVVVVSGY